QREFVWSRRSVMLLFDSLYRQLPIGHMLVWKARRPVTTRRFSHRPKAAEPMYDNFYGYLLDGQQRLTAISRVKDGDEEYPLLFNLWSESDDEDEEQQT